MTTTTYYGITSEDELRAVLASEGASEEIIAQVVADVNAMYAAGATKTVTHVTP